MEGKITQIEEKSKQLQEEMQRQSSFLNELNNAIKKLRNDRKVTIANLSKIDGAIQAYSESVRLIKEGLPKDSGEATQ